MNVEIEITVGPEHQLPSDEGERVEALEKLGAVPKAFTTKVTAPLRAWYAAGCAVAPNGAVQLSQELRNALAVALAGDREADVGAILRDAERALVAKREDERDAKARADRQAAETAARVAKEAAELDAIRERDGKIRAERRAYRDRLLNAPSLLGPKALAKLREMGRANDHGVMTAAEAHVSQCQACSGTQGAVCTEDA